MWKNEFGRESTSLRKFRGYMKFLPGTNWFSTLKKQRYNYCGKPHRPCHYDCWDDCQHYRSWSICVIWAKASTSIKMTFNFYDIILCSKLHFSKYSWHWPRSNWPKWSYLLLILATPIISWLAWRHNYKV